MIVEAAGLRKAFGSTTVLAGVDLHVAEGACFALLGPNGAGKTTTVRILTTLPRPDGGTVRIAGYDVVREPAAGPRRDQPDRAVRRGRRAARPAGRTW